MDNRALFLDRWLQFYFPHSNGKDSIDKAILTSRGFDFDFNTAITIVENAKIFWILDYGYSVQKDNKLIIYHGYNPLR